MTATIEVLSKTCSKCLKLKSIECFSKTRRNKDGLQRECKNCVSDYKRQNRQRIAAKQSQWRLANLEQQREYDRKYYVQNAARKREDGRNRYFKKKSNEEEYQKYHERAPVLNRMSKRRYPEKQQARKAVVMAIKSGKLLRPTTCSKCHVSCTPEGHHDSYEKEHQLNVTWLCKQCHEAHHRKHPDPVK